jgi:prepilin-type N-terminal cleavage/methylation domain-containing protein
MNQVNRHYLSSSISGERSFPIFGISRRRSGFTLVELLIVIIILGFLATMIILQINTNIEHVKENALKTNLIAMRAAAELYYHEHGGKYPGRNDVDGNATGDGKAAAAAFEQQLTRYTAWAGKVSEIRSATYKYGPYLMELPTNPFNDNSAVKCDAKNEKLSERKTGGKEGWKFYTKTGVMLANDGDHVSY